MSNLQIGLAIAGGVILAAVVAHGAWTSRRSTPRQALPEVDAVQTVNQAVEPILTDAPFTAADFPSVHLPRKPVMDSLIDVIATIALDAVHPSMAGEAALAAMPSTRRAGSKPFSIEGYNLMTQMWEVPAPGQRYGGFQAGVQLANRSGPLNEIEYSDFVVHTQAFADAIGANPEFPDMLEEVARARELDHFASAHDAQLGFMVRAKSASWSPGFVHQCASRQGFVAGSLPGRMVLPASVEGMPPLVVLSFDAQAALAEDPAQTAIREISLHLDVAQVPRDEAPFDRMREVALGLAQSMEGVVTDDAGQALPAQTLDTIGTELQTLYNTLEGRDLSAGSPLARRLFS